MYTNNTRLEILFYIYIGSIPQYEFPTIRHWNTKSE